MLFRRRFRAGTASPDTPAAFDRLDAELHVHRQDGDHWSDDGVVFVGRLAARLSQPDFAILARTWPHRPAMWQKHCAEVLLFAPPDGAGAVLVDMLRAANPGVADMAAETLQDLKANLPGSDLRNRIDAALRAYGTRRPPPSRA